jgi:DNA-binding NarL/FixJ family response regulator
VSEPMREKRIRLALLDDQALFRTSLARFLASEPGFEVAGECGNSEDVLRILNSSLVDVVLLDINHGGEAGGGFMCAARRNGYQGRFLIVTGAADARTSARAIRFGASGIFLQAEAPDRLLQAITQVANGAIWLDQRIIQLLVDRSVDGLLRKSGANSGSLLSDREQQVLRGILSGLTNKRIGDDLHLSEGSVKASVQQLFAKTGMRRRSQLVRAALEGSLGAVNGLAGNLVARRQSNG